MFAHQDGIKCSSSMAPHPLIRNGSALVVIRLPSEIGPTIPDSLFLVSEASNLLTLPNLYTSLHIYLVLLIQWFYGHSRCRCGSFAHPVIFTTLSWLQHALSISKLQSISWSLWMVVICDSQFHITTCDAMPPVVITKRHSSLHTLIVNLSLVAFLTLSIVVLFVCFDRWVLHCIGVAACVYHT